jgi:hypothetical protein
MTKALTSKQLQALPLVAQGKYGKEVAETVGVSPQTVSGWKSNPNFQAALNEVKWGIVHSTMDKFRIAGDRAVEILLEIANHSENEETRRKACMNILEYTGLKDSEGAVLGMGIGYTNPADIEKYGKKTMGQVTDELDAILDKILSDDFDEDEESEEQD